MARHANGAAAEAFCASRLGAAGCQAFGTLGMATDAGALVRRASFEPE
jgi:hypothetical protein